MAYEKGLPMITIKSAARFVVREIITRLLALGPGYLTDSAIGWIGYGSAIALLHIVFHLSLPISTYLPMCLLAPLSACASISFIQRHDRMRYDPRLQKTEAAENAARFRTAHGIRKLGLFLLLAKTIGPSPTIALIRTGKSDGHGLSSLDLCLLVLSVLIANFFWASRAGLIFFTANGGLWKLAMHVFHSYFGN